MAIITNVLCDGFSTENPCTVVDGKPRSGGFSAGFDTERETWGDILNALSQEGWSIHGGPEQRSIKCYCPVHAKTKETT